ncbi:glycosyltransferase [Rhodohalobacter sp.]|uniref:glycosyltransferase n=1 Tax=Rhodohalobacter sp. TaxID=1974210 RepID=UPI002ACDBF17|nr:glycosyltransferase [Rhodohalobacter sp.]
MMMRKPLKLIFYAIVLLVIMILGYKLYLNVNVTDFEAKHTEQIDAIRNKLVGQTQFKFAVVGNINNSIGIFEKQLIPKINASDSQFLISAGNAVLDGGVDKYQALEGTLNHLNIPYLLTFGENEYESFGGFRFYEHYGPYYFSFVVADSRFIFLDSTGKTPWSWQLQWLTELMKSDQSNHQFIFVSKPVLKVPNEYLFGDDDEDAIPDSTRTELIEIIERYSVDAVFSSEIPTFNVQKRQDTYFVTTGGAGGLDLNTDRSFYHYVDVSVSKDSIQIQQKAIDEGQGLIARQLENLWFFIYSFFYVGYLNFFLLVGVLVLISIKLYTTIYESKEFYPIYEVDPSPWLDKTIRVAMFTDNYLPFIGGVPISISRLYKGLKQLKNKVLIIAPSYHNQSEKEEDVFRVPSLISFGKESEFRMANIFLKKIRNTVYAFKPDIIHVHHPFWMGSLGLFIARWKKIPAVFTYHTRLEHYAHFVPLPTRLFRNLISHLLIRRFANKCDGIIVPTNSVEKYLHMIGVETPCFVQSTGIEFEEFQQVEPEKIQNLKESLGIEDEIVLLSVSRLSDEKNIDFMIEALSKLKKSIQQPFTFLMIGDGHKKDELQKKVARLGLSENVQLVGSVDPDEMKTWYNLGDIFLFASKSETQGMVILEAMAAGLPVVAVKATGIDDVVEDGVNGYKTPEKIALWANKVQLLIDDKNHRKKLSDNAREFSSSYSIRKFADNIKQIYATVLSAHKQNMTDTKSE